jgi:hypothetical protein
MAAKAISYGLVETAIDASSTLFLMHAALVEKDGRGLLLPGRSGSGKTSLALSLSQAGWRYVTDDVVPVDLQTASVMTFPRPANIKDLSVVPGFEETWADMPWLPHPPGLLPPDVLPVTDRPTIAPAWIVFPRFGGEPEGLDALTPGQAAALLGDFVRAIDPSIVKTLVRLAGAADAAKATYRSTRTALGLIQKFCE